MPIEIRVPRLGWSMEQGVFHGWLAAPGDPIEPGRALFRLEGDKAVQDIEAVDRGVLCVPADAPREGEEVLVGQVLGFLLGAREVAPTTVGPRPAPPAPVVETSALMPIATNVVGLAHSPTPANSLDSAPATFATPTERRRRRAAATGAARHAGAIPSRRRGLPRVSPRAARLARERGVDWTRLRGSGAGERIRAADVLAASTQQALPSTQSVPLAAPRGDSVEAAWAEYQQRHGARAEGAQLTRFTPLRRTIAEQLGRARDFAVPVTLTTLTDATALVAWREQLRQASDAEASYTELIGWLVARELPRHPLLNAHSLGEAPAMVLYDRVHLGVAVDTEAGLFTPVVRDAARLSQADFARELRRLVAAARQRRLTAEELQGGTFTISNLGGFGIDAFTPVLHWPQTAILGLGRIARTPCAADDGTIVVRWTLPLSLTFDHRILDGAPAAAALASLRAAVEKPGVQGSP